MFSGNHMLDLMVGVTPRLMKPAILAPAIGAGPNNLTNSGTDQSVPFVER